MPKQQLSKLPLLLSPITIYTDGSCHTQLKIGAWAAIIFISDQQLILSDGATNTTHQRMELTAVIQAIQHIQTIEPGSAVNVVTDSQYVVGLQQRQNKLMAQGYTTKAGHLISNADLLASLFELTQTTTVHFQKIKAHQQKTGSANYNIQADKLCRKLVREAVAAAT